MRKIKNYIDIRINENGWFAFSFDNRKEKIKEAYNLLELVGINIENIKAGRALLILDKIRFYLVSKYKFLVSCDEIYYKNDKDLEKIRNHYLEIRHYDIITKQYIKK